jgi:hypothetical protein
MPRAPVAPCAPKRPEGPVGPVTPVGPIGPNSPDELIVKPLAAKLTGINITYIYFNHSGLFGTDRLIVTSSHCLYQIFNSFI